MELGCSRSGELEGKPTGQGDARAAALSSPSLVARGARRPRSRWPSRSLGPPLSSLRRPGGGDGRRRPVPDPPPAPPTRRARRAARGRTPPPPPTPPPVAPPRSSPLPLVLPPQPAPPLHETVLPDGRPLRISPLSADPALAPAAAAALARAFAARPRESVGLGDAREWLVRRSAPDAGPGPAAVVATVPRGGADGGAGAGGGRPGPAPAPAPPVVVVGVACVCPPGWPPEEGEPTFGPRGGGGGGGGDPLAPPPELSRLTNLGVLPSARRSGVGRALVAGAARLAAAEWGGGGGLALHVEAGNAAARGLYRACGFATAAEDGPAARLPPPLGRGRAPLALMTRRPPGPGEGGGGGAGGR